MALSLLYLVECSVDKWWRNHLCQAWIVRGKTQVRDLDNIKKANNKGKHFKSKKSRTKHWLKRGQVMLFQYGRFHISQKYIYVQVL